MPRIYEAGARAKREYLGKSVSSLDCEYLLKWAFIQTLNPKSTWELEHCQMGPLCFMHVYVNFTSSIMALFSSRKFLDFATVALSALFDNYYLIID